MVILIPSIILYVSANPMSNIRVVPVGSTETGEPIVTQSPTTFMIYVTTSEYSPIHNVWLLIVLNAPTYEALHNITVDTTTFDQTCFNPVRSSESPRIPPLEPDLTSAPPYPGCQYDEQYETSAIRDKLGATGEDIYYGYKFFKDQIDTIPYEFTVTLNLDSSCSDVKVLILALGRFKNPPGPFDAHSPYDGTTLVVPELSPLILVLASLTALGVYAIKRRKSLEKL